MPNQLSHPLEVLKQLLPTINGSPPSNDLVDNLHGLPYNASESAIPIPAWEQLLYINSSNGRCSSQDLPNSIKHDWSKSSRI